MKLDLEEVRVLMFLGVVAEEMVLETLRVCDLQEAVVGAREVEVRVLRGIGCILAFCPFSNVSIDMWGRPFMRRQSREKVKAVSGAR